MGHSGPAVEDYEGDLFGGGRGEVSPDFIGSFAFEPIGWVGEGNAAGAGWWWVGAGLAWGWDDGGGHFTLGYSCFLFLG